MHVRTFKTLSASCFDRALHARFKSQKTPPQILLEIAKEDFSKEKIMSHANIKIFTALNPEILEDKMNEYFGNLDEDYDVISANYVFNPDRSLYSSMVMFNTKPYVIDDTSS